MNDRQRRLLTGMLAFLGVIVLLSSAMRMWPDWLNNPPPVTSERPRNPAID